MNKQATIYGVCGLTIGLVIAWAISVTAVNGNHPSMMRMMGMHTNPASTTRMIDDDMSMSQMMSSLQGKTGDDFDKTFIAEMIAHHQGAIDMANLAKANAKHNEIKKMADDIVTAQSKEINQMKTWQANWGYSASAGSHDMMN